MLVKVPCRVVVCETIVETGDPESSTVGVEVGIGDGPCEGNLLGSIVGLGAGPCEGNWLGSIVGLGVGNLVDDDVGTKLVGDKDGDDEVGIAVGDDVGFIDALDVTVVTAVEVLVNVCDDDCVVDTVLVVLDVVAVVVGELVNSVDVLLVSPVVVWDVVIVVVSVTVPVVVALVVTLELPVDVCELVKVNVSVVVGVVKAVDVMVEVAVVSAQPCRVPSAVASTTRFSADATKLHGPEVKRNPEMSQYTKCAPAEANAEFAAIITLSRPAALVHSDDCRIAVLMGS